MSALAALLGRAAGPLQFGEAFDDPSRKLVDKYIQRSGGDHNLAAKAAWNDRERKRKINNMVGGQSLLSAENQSRFGGGDAHMLQAAVKLKNLAASGGKTQGAYDTRQPDTRMSDPRLSTQGRASLERTAQNTNRAIERQTAAQQQAAATETAKANERRRMQVEGDAWLEQLKTRPSALGALAAR